MRIYVILLTLLSFLAFGCRDDDSSNNSTNNNNHVNNNNNNNNTNDDTVYQVQDPSSNGFIADGGDVVLENVIVTAIDNYGSKTGSFWVSETPAEAYSGVMVFNTDLTAEWWQNLKIGDLVTVRGQKQEYSYHDPDSGDPLFDDPVTEVVNPQVTVLGTSTAPAPVVIDASDLNTVATGEKWEGVIVTIKNVRVTKISDRDGRHEVEIYQSTKLQDDLMDLSSIQEGACLSSVTGIVTYFFGYYILPRTTSDIEVSADDSACPQVADEICDDGVDNDGNGFTDCDDFACTGDPACPAKVENDDTLCADGQDNDGDGLTDCQDPSCYGHPDVTVCTETACDDGVDNDGDGYSDCDDFDCSNDPACSGSFEQNCTDGNDDDGDTYVDCDDNDCSDDPACMESGAECSDTTDNDGDGFTDCDDFDCLYEEGGYCSTNVTDKEFTDALCSDNIDNDGNGFTDCEDFSCQRSPLTSVCEGNARTCSDGIDNDGNGFTDCGDFSCRYCNDTDPSKDRVVSTCPPCEHNN